VSLDFLFAHERIVMLDGGPARPTQSGDIDGSRPRRNSDLATRRICRSQSPLQRQAPLARALCAQDHPARPCTSCPRLAGRSPAGDSGGRRVRRLQSCRLPSARNRRRRRIAAAAPYVTYNEHLLRDVPDHPEGVAHTWILNRRALAPDAHPYA